MSNNHEDIQNNIKMPNLSQEPPASSIAQNKDLQDTFFKGKDAKSKPLISSTLQNPNQDVCWTFIIIVAKIWNNDTSNISDQIMIKTLTPKRKLKQWLNFLKTVIQPVTCPTTFLSLTQKLRTMQI